MTATYSIRSAVLCIALFAVAAPFAARGADAPEKPLLDLAAPDAVNRFAPTSADVTAVAADGGILVTVNPGNDGYPGVDLKPESGTFDLTGYGHVEVRVTNTGTKPLALNARVDGQGNWQDNPWNTESATIKPGGSGAVKVIFGFAYGYKPSYPLKPDAIVQVKLFTAKSKETVSYRVDSVVAAGPAGEQPKVDPANVRIKPKDGQLLTPDVQVEAKGAVAKVTGGGRRCDVQQSRRRALAEDKARAGPVGSARGVARADQDQEHRRCASFTPHAFGLQPAGADRFDRRPADRAR